MFIKQGGAWLSKVELCGVLSAIYSDSNSRPLKPIEECVSLLTSDSRPNWANARNLLLKGMPKYHL